MIRRKSVLFCFVTLVSSLCLLLLFLLFLLLPFLTFFTFLHRSEIDTYRLMHLRTTAIMWNDAFAEHSRYSPNCSSCFLNWDIDREVKFGLCWRESLSCSKCQYKSKIYKLYEELPCTTRGRRPARLNRGLHIGLSQSSIGPACLAKILCSKNTPPPSLSVMQKAGNLVKNTITDENKKDTQNCCQSLRHLNTLWGKNPAAVNIQADGCYNNALYSGVGKTPFQPSTIAIYLLLRMKQTEIKS